MNVLFEDDGQLKAATLLADHDASLQVEAVSGKRQKIKASQVLLRFAEPSPADTLARAHDFVADLDPNFLWEVVPDDEFGFEELAREYYGNAFTPPQAAAVALALARAPMYFYRKGRGRFRRAPPDALKAALASITRKEREARDVAQWSRELAEGRLPQPLVAKLDMLLYRADKNATEWKALTAACEATKKTPLQVLFDAGAIASTHEFHFRRFIVEAFPRGTDFPAWGALPEIPELPVADVRAFSIDDASTTEIDDAFSVRALDGGGSEIGIHIACPGIAIAHGTPIDALARGRLSTVYMPGRKLTMLPDEVVDAFTLSESRSPPALSLYISVDAEGKPLAHRTSIERVPVAANLRLDALTEAFAAPPSADDPPWTPELRVLWKLASHLAAARDRPETPRVDYSFHVDWDREGAGERGHVSIVPRSRGNMLDKLVAELMIHVNATWGRRLGDARVPGLYRVQSAGKVKMSTRPGEHQGLGLSHYLWASSPLRRYSDLVNQRQLIATVQGTRAPYAANDPELFAALGDFEATYASYAEMQNRMEHYWCLRWLVQEKIDECTASVIRENLVRFDRLPIVMRLADMPGQPPQARVRVLIGRVDLLGCTFEARFAGLAG